MNDRKSRMLEPLGSLYIAFASRSIKTVLFIQSYRFQRPRGRVNCKTRAGAPRARDAWRKFTEIYGIPRAARELCSDLLLVIGTVLKNNIRGGLVDFFDARGARARSRHARACS
jgi:hypothetical protein